MTYELKTIDGKHKRLLNDEDFKTLLNFSLRNGWRPSPRHFRNGRLFMSEVLTLEDARDLAKAIDRSLHMEGAKLLPPVMVAFLECIGVLRRGEAKFVRLL